MCIMKHIAPQTRTNLESIIHEVDVLCKGVRFPKRRSKVGRPPIYTDKFIIKLVILQYLLGFTSERSYLRFLKNLDYSLFNKLPDNSRYNRRAKNLKPLIKKLTLRIFKELKVEQSKIRVIDATPVPVIRYARAKRRKIFTDKNKISIGYCASQKTYYCGVKLNLLVNQNGIPCVHSLIAANRHDLIGAKQIIQEQNLKGLILVGDKGYLMKEDEKKGIKRKRLIQLITPYRRNQKKKNNRREKKFLQKRRIIETVNSQLKDQMGLERLRAKNYQGLTSRIDNLIFTYLFGVYFNKLTGRNPLSLKSILT